MSDAFAFDLTFLSPFFLDAKNPRRVPRVGSVVSVVTDYSATPLLPRSCGMYIDMTMAKTGWRLIVITSYI